MASPVAVPRNVHEGIDKLRRAANVDLRRPDGVAQLVRVAADRGLMAAAAWVDLHPDALRRGVFAGFAPSDGPDFQVPAGWQPTPTSAQTEVTFTVTVPTAADDYATAQAAWSKLQSSMQVAAGPTERFDRVVQTCTFRELSDA